MDNEIPLWFNRMSLASRSGGCWVKSQAGFKDLSTGGLSINTQFVKSDNHMDWWGEVQQISRKLEGKVFVGACVYSIRFHYLPRMLSSWNLPCCWSPSQMIWQSLQDENWVLLGCFILLYVEISNMLWISYLQHIPNIYHSSSFHPPPLCLSVVQWLELMFYQAKVVAGSDLSTACKITINAN